MLQNEVVLITGATGFIGKHLLSELIKKHGKTNIKIAVFSKAECTNNELFTGLEIIEVGDISGTTNWNPALTNVNAVVHLAGRAHVLIEKSQEFAEAECERINVAATKKLALDALQNGVKHFIFVSSIKAVCDEADICISEATECKPLSIYGKSKLKAENEIKNIFANTVCRYTIIRPTLVYGAGNLGNMQRLVNLIGKGLPLPFACATGKRSFVYVGNLVNAFLTVINNEAAYQKTFIVSDGYDLSSAELIVKIAKVLKIKLFLFPIPVFVFAFFGILGDLIAKIIRKDMPINSKMVGSLFGTFVVDSSHIRNTLKWVPPCSVDEGLGLTLKDKLRVNCL